MREFQFTMCAVAGAILAMAGAAQANALGNPGFEAPDASGGDVPDLGAPWYNFGAPFTRFTTTAFAHSGTQSLKMFGPFDFLGGGTGGGQTVSAAPGDTWVGEAWALNSSTDPIGAGNFLALKVEFLDAGFGPAGGSFTAGVNVFEAIFDEFAPTDVWTMLGVGTAPAPAGTAYANFVLVHVQAGVAITGGSVFVDDANFVLVPAPATAGVLGLGGLAAMRRRRR